MFRMDVGDFEFILGKISHLISPHQISNFGGHLPIMHDERLALTLRYIATGESFKSLSFQFRISLNAVSHIIKKFESLFERANVWNQRKFMNVGWNTPPNQSNMENSYFCVETCWMKFCSGTNFIQHHPTWFFSSFSKLYKFCNCANYSNISSNMAKTWCWMKCWTGLLRPLIPTSYDFLKVAIFFDKKA